MQILQHQIFTMVRIEEATAATSSDAKMPHETAVLTAANGDRASSRMQAMAVKNLEARLERERRERFGDFSYVDFYVRQQNGQTCIGEMREKVEWAIAEGKNISHQWWMAHRARWQMVTHPEMQLSVRTPTELVEASLVQALSMATSPNTRIRSNEKLLSWLASQTSPCNQKSLVGVYRHSLSAHPSTRHLAVCVGVMKFAARLNLQRIFVQECGAMQAHWDSTLCHHLSKVSKGGVRTTVWLAQNMQIVGLVASSEAIKRVQTAADVRQCADDLKMLVSSSGIAERVFGANLSELCYTEYMADLDKIVVDFLGDGVTSSSLADAVSAAAEAAKKWEYDKRCTKYSRVKCSYLNDVEIDVEASDAAAAALKKIHVHIRILGIVNGCIETLWFEKDIFDIDIDEDAPGVEPELADAVNVGRRMMNEEAAMAKPSSGELAVAMMMAKASATVEFDSFSTIDVALARALSTGPGEKRLNAEIFRSLPDATRAISLTVAVGALERLQESALHQFCSPQAQSKLAEVLRATKQLCRGQAPTFDTWTACSTLKKIMEFHLPMFCAFDDADNASSSVAKIVRGKAAAQQHFEKVEGLKEAPTLADLEMLTMYDWLLERPQQLQVQTWLQQIWAGAGMAGVTAATKRTTTASAASAAKKPRTSTTTTAEDEHSINVANLFA